MSEKFNFVVVGLWLTIFLAGISNAIIWPCSSNDDCTANGSICFTEKGVCECTDFESVFSSNYSKCLKASLFGDTCDETVQCNLMPSGANCKLGVCDCDIDGHTYVRGRCRLLNGLDESCDTDLDCYFGYDRQSVTCQNRFCACADGYYRRNGNICRRKSMEIDDACVVNTDCDELGSNVKCIDLKCQYENDADRINTNEKIEAKAKLITETSIGSEAASQLSKSSKSFEETTLDSLQSPSLTASLLSQTQAKINAAILVNGDNDLLGHGTESSETANSERKPSLREIAVQTSLDAFELKPLRYSVGSQVRNVGTATASTSTSSRRDPYYRRRRISGYRTDDENKTYSTPSNTDDEVEEHKYGSSCMENGKACNGLAHSICSNSLCLCRQGYYHKSGKCFAELGEIAESDDECEHTFDKKSKKCICQKNYFYDRSLRECRKPIPYQLSCVSNSQCSPFGYAYCRTDIPRRCTCVEYAEYDAIQQMCLFKQGLGAKCESDDVCLVDNSICSNRYCICKTNFIQKNETCVAGIGADCKSNDDCIVKNAICENKIETKNVNDEKIEDERICQCRKGFVHFKDECLQEAIEIDDECIDSEQCKPLLGTCIDKKCTCTAEQHLKYGRCEEKKGIDKACSREGECFIEKTPENVECRNSICKCKIGYQADVEQRACIRVVPNKKNSSGRPSVLKIITFLLFGSAFLITSAAIRSAYY